MKIKNTIFSFALIIVGITAVTAAPTNDNWESAIDVPGLGGNTSGVNTGGSAQPCEPVHAFAEQSNLQPQSSVWYKWQVPATGSYTVKIVAGGFPMVLSAYSFAVGVCNGVPMNIPYRIRETSDYNNNPYRPQVTFRAVQGSTIHIAIDSATNVLSGSFNFTIEKTKYQYGAQLDYSNSAADLAVNDAFGRWWFGRREPFTTQVASSTVVWGDLGDRVFMADFNGDAVSDLAVARPDNGKFTWWIADKFGNQIKVVQFGLTYDHPLVGDWDGDGMADIAVTRNDFNTGRKIWHFLRSSDGQYQSLQYGLVDDKPMVGDYDGDGKTDLAVLRPTPQNTYTWYIRNSSDGTNISREFGLKATDVPQAADFDGDGKTDITMFRNDGTWYSLDSSSPIPIGQRPTRIVKWGTDNDRAQAADYDADGKTDYAIYRDGQWWVLGSRYGEVNTYTFGTPFHIVMTDGGLRNAFFFY